MEELDALRTQLAYTNYCDEQRCNKRACHLPSNPRKKLPHAASRDEAVFRIAHYDEMTV